MSVALAAVYLERFSSSSNQCEQFQHWFYFM